MILVISIAIGAYLQKLDSTKLAHVRNSTLLPSRLYFLCLR